MHCNPSTLKCVVIIQGIKGTSEAERAKNVQATMMAHQLPYNNIQAVVGERGNVEGGDTGYTMTPPYLVPLPGSQHKVSNK